MPTKKVDGKTIDITDDELSAHIDSLAQSPEELAAIEIEENDRSNIKNDAILSFIENNSMAEIDAWVSNRFSELAGMSKTDIDNYIDANIVNLDTSKAALKILANDISKTMVILRITTKIAVFLLKRAI